MSHDGARRDSTSRDDLIDAIVAFLTGHDLLTLEVVDDGCGFDVETTLTGHGLGLISMRERLRAVNGDIIIESEPGVGTRVRADVPLRPAPIETDAANMSVQLTL